jgi:hypothetical protein
MITKATSHPVDQAKTLNLNNLPWLFSLNPCHQFHNIWFKIVLIW